MTTPNSWYTLSPVETGRDQRGWVSNLLDFVPLPAARIRNVHLVEIKPGCVRGNHVHRKQMEWIIICGGPTRVVVAAGDERFETVLDGERPMMLKVTPGTAHAVRYEGDGRAYLVAITDTEYDFNAPDVEGVNLLD